MILAGDIGGTKTILALFERSAEGLEMRHRVRYNSADFSGLPEVVQAFRGEHREASIEAACFGIAGPVTDGLCKATNLAWVVSQDDLAHQLDTPRVWLLNDLEAMALGMLGLDESEFVDLNPGVEMVNANRAVIAPGTGLGEALLYWDGRGFRAVASEGGHSDFAARTPRQWELLRWLERFYPQHVSVERVISGAGLPMIYAFLRDSGYAVESAYMMERTLDADVGALISRRALSGEDPLCAESMRLFIEILGAEAGNLALKYLSVGGVYIGGGIAPQILPLLRDGNFMQNFVAKGRFEERLAGMAVKVALNTDTVLLGAAGYCLSA